MLQFADVSWASTVSLFTAVIHAAVLSKYPRYWTRQLDIEKKYGAKKEKTKPNLTLPKPEIFRIKAI
jgi:hypothetical protein